MGVGSADETMLQCKVVSHWLNLYPELPMISYITLSNHPLEYCVKGLRDNFGEISERRSRWSSWVVFSWLWRSQWQSSMKRNRQKVRTTDRTKNLLGAKFVFTGGPIIVTMAINGSANDDTVGIIRTTSCAAIDDKVSIIISLHFQRYSLGSGDAYMRQ